MNPHWVQYAPLVLAVYEVVSTLLFVCHGLRGNVSPSTFLRVQMLWWIATVAGGIGSTYWVMYHSFRAEGVFSRVLVLLFLGAIFPIHGGFGLVAWARPDWWQRFVGSRDRARHWAREQKREQFHRTSERLRRFMGGPPTVCFPPAN